MGRAKNLTEVFIQIFRGRLPLRAITPFILGGGMEGIKLKQIDTLLGGRYETWLRIMRAVYSDDGLSPTIHTCGGATWNRK